MTYPMPKLPYEMNALEPHISAETLEYHYGKHHRAYVTNLNKLMEESDLEMTSLEAVIQNSKGGIFNNAAQVWNHTFYWHCLSPNGGELNDSEFQRTLEDQFGSLEEFKARFSDVAMKTFGSGWAWLVKTQQGALDIISTSNANTPISDNLIPLLTCDVWEHAYYVDYRNARAKYIESFWHLVNWEFVAKNHSQSSVKIADFAIV